MLMEINGKNYLNKKNKDKKEIKINMKIKTSIQEPRNQDCTR